MKPIKSQGRICIVLVLEMVIFDLVVKKMYNGGSSTICSQPTDEKELLNEREDNK